LTVKIFLKEANEQLVSDALETTLNEMGICSVETVILSFKPVSDEDVYLNSLKKLWKVLESLVGKGLVYTLGVCDLNINHLQTLYEWAEIKPIINQMNLANCCVIPPEMSQYAQNKEIQLLTHSDPVEILSDEALQELLVSKFAVQWVSRYSVLIKCRGIIKSKGFAVKAKNSKK
ncbi:hypothetical protein HELRODRAFT_67967, partial [Helobdella robusta]|uniref:GCS light chain n=1 Tax=Helobdella robusta TaxID=6412 RepID=T1FZ88_HELRO